MRRAIEGNRTPNLLTLHYDLQGWTVRNLTLIPSFAFSLSCVEVRKPLGPTARRKGWVGCNILLARIPVDAKIPMVLNGLLVGPDEVRTQYARLRPLDQIDHERRGWALDVLNALRSLHKRRLILAEVYSFADVLQRLHPKNLHVREKIRQQLQRLRDMGFVEFLGHGEYLLRE